MWSWNQFSLFGWWFLWRFRKNLISNAKVWWLNLSCCPWSRLVVNGAASSILFLLFFFCYYILSMCEQSSKGPFLILLFTYSCDCWIKSSKLNIVFWEAKADSLMLGFGPWYLHIVPWGYWLGVYLSYHLCHCCLCFPLRYSLRHALRMKWSDP